MRELGACKLTDVLAEWGSHNTEWRVGRVVTDPADAVEFALTYYGPLVSMILSSEPFACFRSFVVYDGWHRGAAWVLRGAVDPIAARLVVTKRPPNLWRAG